MQTIEDMEGAIFLIDPPEGVPGCRRDSAYRCNEFDLFGCGERQRMRVPRDERANSLQISAALRGAEPRGNHASLLEGDLVVAMGLVQRLEEDAGELIELTEVVFLGDDEELGVARGVEQQVAARARETGVGPNECVRVAGEQVVQRHALLSLRDPHDGTSRDEDRRDCRQDASHATLDGAGGVWVGARISFAAPCIIRYNQRLGQRWEVVQWQDTRLWTV